jgi:hypothetical protein
MPKLIVTFQNFAKSCCDLLRLNYRLIRYVVFFLSMLEQRNNIFFINNRIYLLEGPRVACIVWSLYWTHLPSVYSI